MSSAIEAPKDKESASSLRPEVEKDKVRASLMGDKKRSTMKPHNGETDAPRPSMKSVMIKENAVRGTVTIPPEHAILEPTFTEPHNSEVDEEEEEDEKEMEEQATEEMEAEMESENVEPEIKIEPTFICHEVSGGPMNARLSIPTNPVDPNSDLNVEIDAFYPPLRNAARYRMLNPDDLQYRPAAMAEINSKLAQYNNKKSNIVAKIIFQVNTQLRQYGCQRGGIDKNKANSVATQSTLRRGVDENTNNQGTTMKFFRDREGMDKLMTRLKIYKRALSTLVIYFRAYSPLLFNIKKSYDDLLNFRIRQFREAQHEKLRIYNDVHLVYSKMRDYQFPDFDKLMNGQQYLNLLLIRIQKQDEAIKCITEILSKMERALGEHYEQERDLEDQIRMLEHEQADRAERNEFPKKKYEIVDENENKDVGSTLIEEFGDGQEEEEPEPDIIMDEDRRMVYILAYAVCLKDYEDVQKKLKVYESRYQNVAPRHELESTKRMIQEEKLLVKSLADDSETLEQDLLALKDDEMMVADELEKFRAMPYDERLEAVKAKFIRDMEDYSGNEQTFDEEEEYVAEDTFDEEAMEDEIDL